jgi:uncharacterized protein
MSVPRDRDPAGGVSEEREPTKTGGAQTPLPRDELGRPLPRTAAQQVPRVPDDLAVTPAEGAALGGSLLAEGRPFQAHEVFEAVWKSQAGDDRGLWRGLAQIAVGLTHARRGNTGGAVTLLRRGAAGVRGHAGKTTGTGGIDPEFVAATAEDLAARIERDGLAAVPAADLLLALHRPGPG